MTISFLPHTHQLYQLRLMTLLARCGRQHNTSAQKQLQKLPALALIGDYGSEGRLLARLRVLLEARGCRVWCVLDANPKGWFVFADDCRCRAHGIISLSSDTITRAASPLTEERLRRGLRSCVF